VTPAAIAGVVAVVFVGGFSAGWATRGWREDSTDLKAVQQAAARLNDARKWQDQAAAEFERGRAQADVREVQVTQEVVRVVSKPVYLERCLDDDGLRLISADIDAANARRGFAPAVPASAGDR
jgi:hypothetical protein